MSKSKTESRSDIRRPAGIDIFGRWPPGGLNRPGFTPTRNLLSAASVLYAMEDNEKLPWYRDSQTELPFRLTTYSKVRRVCSAPCHVLQRD